MHEEQNRPEDCCEHQRALTCEASLRLPTTFVEYKWIHHLYYVMVLDRSQMLSRKFAKQARPILQTKDRRAAFKHDLWRLHLSESHEQYQLAIQECMEAWPESLSNYIRAQWIEGRHCNWQVFAGRVGCTRSNQGTESCNSIIKRFFTFRKVSKLSECMAALCRVAESYGLKRKPFARVRKFSKKFLKLTAGLARNRSDGDGWEVTISDSQGRNELHLWAFPQIYPLPSLAQGIFYVAMPRSCH